jgi:antitoxin (DNA-binding transcriptional repressor) of toxin-antitoxin stability system
MKTVGIRELKNKLSEHLRDVQRGETLLVTDRGNVIAEVAPPGYGKSDPSTPAGITALARRGLVSVGAPGGEGLYRALPRLRRGRISARQLLDEERGSR